ncbi:MAG: DUF928 domain-containing protein [Cyanobacteria bacterium P01_F01_bin.150]
MTSSLLALTAIASPAQATYTPPEGDAPSGSTVAGGSRTGCDASSSLPATPLAPVAHIGQSATNTPTLAWFVTATAPYRVKVSLYQRDSNQQLEEVYTEIRIDEQGGVGSLTLPEEMPLADGEDYSWLVAIGCDIENPRYTITMTSNLHIAVPDELVIAEIDTALTATNSDTERADVYASRAYWFDALNELMSGRHGNIAAHDDIAALLNQLGNLEVAVTDPAAELHGANLLKIADALAEGLLTTEDLQNTPSSNNQTYFEPRL